MNEIKINKIEDNKDLLKIGPTVGTKIYKRSLIANIRFLEDVHAEDLVFILQSFLEAKNIVYLNNYFSYYYRMVREFNEMPSITHTNDKETLMKLLYGYSEAYSILKSYKKEELFITLFKGHLQYWSDKFILSDTSNVEKKELLEEIGFLFEEVKKYNKDPTLNYLIPFFNIISKKEYEEAIMLTESLKEIIMTNQSLEEQESRLKNELEIKTNELSEHLKTFGYFKYKSKNIISRINIKLKIQSHKMKSQLYKLKNISTIVEKFSPWIKYKTLTLILPHRKTNDADREINLDITLKYLSKIGISNIIISEHSDISSKKSLINEYSHLFKSFKVLNSTANGELFNKAKAINNGVLESKTSYIAIFDVDCLTKKKNINLALDLLKKGYDVVHPFDRKVIDVVDKENFKRNYDFNKVDFPIQNRRWADGGIVFWNKNSFISIGMKNEYFSGWGGEDNEIMVRANLFNLRQYRIPDNLYHLYHYRPQKRTKNNAEQLQKIEQMNIESCLKEINSWPWIIEAKEKLNFDERTRINTKQTELKDQEYSRSLLLNENKFNSDLISKFYPLYILFNKKNHSIKNALINIKGYRSIKKNNLLDFDYYLYNNELRKSGIDPILHYIYHGFREGRNPNSAFDSDYYLKAHGDVKKSNLNPLVHYSLYGINEGRKTKRS